MAIEKTGYAPAILGTTKVKVGTDNDGYIIAPGTQAAGTKTISINKVAAENGLQDNTDVLAFFMDLANGVQYSDTNTMAVTWGV